MVGPLESNSVARGQFKADFKAFLLRTEIFRRDVYFSRSERTKSILVGLLADEIGQAVEFGSIRGGQPVIK